MESSSRVFKTLAVISFIIALLSWLIGDNIIEQTTGKDVLSYFKNFKTNEIAGILLATSFIFLWIGVGSIIGFIYEQGQEKYMLILAIGAFVISVALLILVLFTN